MTEHPKRLPPFKPELRDAIRRGTKTQTRRVIKEQPGEFAWIEPDYNGGWQYGCDVVTYGENLEMGADQIYSPLKCPYGKPGDIRFLIEPLAEGDDHAAYYRDTNELVWENDDDTWPMMWPEHWKRDTSTSIYMPTVAARTFVRLKDVRVELVQEISEADAIAEGAQRPPIGDDCSCSISDKGFACDHGEYRRGFALLWDSINGKRCPWSDNAWVWVIEWELLDGNPA